MSPARRPAETLGPMWVKNTDPERWRPPGPHDRLGDVEYTSPMADLAPWYDPDSPESGAQFAGAIPHRGNGSSTRSSEVFEFTTDGGGNPGTLRHGTKTVTSSVWL